MTALILDTDNKMVEFWMKRIQEWLPDTEIVCCKTKQEALWNSMIREIDIFIVNLVLEEKNRYKMSGLEFLVEIRKKPIYKLTDVIICTDIDDQHFFSYPNLHCYRYIEKPLREQDLRECYELLFYTDDRKRRMESNDSFIYIRNNRGFFCVDASVVVRMEIHKNRSLLITETEELEIDSRLANAMKEDLIHRGWIQCNRSDYVNKKYILLYYQGFLKLKKGFGNIPLTEIGKQGIRRMIEGQNKRNLE